MLIWTVSLLFLWSTGEIVATACRLRVRDPLVGGALRIALGLSVWPIVFLAATTLRIAVPVVAMRVIVLATAGAGVAFAVARLRRMRWRRVRVRLPFLVAFAALAILAVVTRWFHIRGLAFPPWVDGVHHAMIVRLLLEHGLVPDAAAPYIPGAPLLYHWGFHVPAAFVAAAAGATRHSDTPALLLQYGQLLNALSVFAVYAAGRALLRSRKAALLGAALAMFVSFYPAFYLSWGRYTHLAGTLILPPLLIALVHVARGRMAWRWNAVATLLAAGLVLVHVRMALFALVFALVLLVPFRRCAGVVLLRWGVVASIALLLVLPWVLALGRDPHSDAIVAATGSRNVTMELVASRHNRELLALATGGVSGLAGWLGMPLLGRVLSGVWWLAIVLAARRRRRGPWGPLLVLCGWLALLAILLYGMPFIATLDSLVITLFLPLSLAGAALVAWVLRGRWVVPLAVVVAIGGAWLTRDVVNPATVFADDADLRAMRWIERYVPRDAVFAVEGRPWMPPSYAGTDGGYWLHVAAGRRSILPPLLYAWTLPPERVAAINDVVARSGDWRAMRAAGVTHFYAGPHGSPERAEALLATNALRVIYRDDGVVVAELR